MKRLAASLRGAPFRHVLLGAVFLALAVSTAWFCTARDARGPTARLTADAWYYHAYLPSLYLDGDLDFSNEYEITKNWYRFGQTDVGRPSNVFGIGPAVFETPAFLGGHLVARLSGREADGFSEPEVFASLYMSLLLSLAALVPAALVLRRRLGGRWLPVLAPVLLLAAGPVIYYAVRQPGYAHPFATFWVAWLVERWDASFDGASRPRSLRTWLVFGALLGASALARPQCALWMVILLFAAADDVRRVQASEATRTAAELGRVLLPRWLAGAAVSLVVFSPQLFAWNAIYGEPLITPQGPGFMWWTDPAWSEVLFSSRNGLFPWAPLYGLAALGLLSAIARAPRVGVALVLGVALQVVANGAVWDWWAGGSFGGRRFDSTFVAFAFGLGCLLIWPGRSALRGWRYPATRLLSAGVLIVALLLAAGNVALARLHSAPTVRIQGGDPAFRVLRAQIRGPLGRFVATASWVANAPARLLFAWRYGTGLHAYDHLVGVHQLGELYPDLNSFDGKTRARLPLDHPGAHHLLGLRPGEEPGTAELRGRSARILVGLNRRDQIELSLRAAAPEETEVELLLNGERIARGRLSERPARVAGVAARVRRGINVLEVRAAPGTRLHALHLRATRDPRGGLGPPGGGAPGDAGR